jgi:hypothetical protein
MSRLTTVHHVPLSAFRAGQVGCAVWLVAFVLRVVPGGMTERMTALTGSSPSARARSVDGLDIADRRSVGVRSRPRLLVVGHRGRLRE